MNKKLVKDCQIGVQKNVIREIYKDIRNNINLKSRIIKSNFIGEKLKNLSIYKNAKIIMFYFSFKSEVITHKMIQQAWLDGKTVVLPVVCKENNQLKAVKITSFEEDLKKGMYGIQEPKNCKINAVNKKKIDLVIVPGLAFDYNGYRLGYGKGYYDFWLKHFPVSKRVGIAFDCQIVETLPIDSYDLPVDKIITETQIINVSN